MAKRKMNPTIVRTKIAALRVKHDITQATLADAIGMSVRGLQELERDEVGNPPLRWLVNIAAAFGVPLEDVCEEKWLTPQKRGLWHWQRPGEPVPRLVGKADEAGDE